jgi:hypothetical protein
MFEILNNSINYTILIKYQKRFYIILILKARMPKEDFEIKGPLGKGSFGQVVKVNRISDQQIYAMKQVSLLLNVDQIAEAQRKR